MDPIQKYFGYGHNGQCAARIRLDLTSCIQFGSILPKKARIILWKKWLRSNLDDLLWFRPDASDLEARWCTRIIRHGSGRIQPAFYQFPTFRLGCVLPQTAQIILCKTSWDPIWFWLTVSGLGQIDPVWKQVGSKSVCKSHWACF